MKIRSTSEKALSYYPIWLMLWLALLSLGNVARGYELSLLDKGVHIDAGSMGEFDLGYPALMNAAGQPVHKIISATPKGKAATVIYDGNVTLQVGIEDSGEVTYVFEGLTDEIKNFKVAMLIGFSCQQGGHWKFDQKEGDFPDQKPSKPQLFQGKASTFILTNAEGKSLSLEIPDFGYQELTDNREWNWSIYHWQASFPHLPKASTFKIKVGSRSGSEGGSPVAKPVALVDPFGQLKAGDWPGKVRGEDDLKADPEKDKAYYAGLKPPAFDSYGGLPGSMEKLALKASGFFHVEKKGEKWILVDPAGNAFFHLGICAFAPGDDYTWVGGRESTYEWIPPYEGDFKTAFLTQKGKDVLSFYLTNRIRKYGTPYSLNDFQAVMIDRVRKFGFNSVGAFSPVSPAVKAANMPYVSNLPLGEWDYQPIRPIPGINGTWDPFDEGNRGKVDANFARGLPAKADDPLLIGYFLTNEPLYEDIPKVVPGLKGSQWACKRALVQALQNKYRTVSVFNAAWGLSAASFDEMNDAPLAVNTQTAFTDMHDFTGLFLEAYFKLVSETFHKYDTHHLLIGNRFQSGTINSEQLCRIAGKYLDVVSYNYYTKAVDRDALKRINQWTGGKPMFLSEFYWTAPKESGLVGGLEVGTQQDRGLAYRNYVEQSASLGFVVGIEWFTLIDQAATGRWFSKYSGERSNTGLFAVSDRPYKAMLEEMARTNDRIYDVWLNGATPFAFADSQFAQQASGTNIASAPRSTGPIKLDGTTQNWPGVPANVIPGKRLVFGHESNGLEATFKVCWDDRNLYLLVTVIDSTPMMSKLPPDALWQGDALEIFLGSEKLGEGGTLLFTDRHLLVGVPGAGKAPFFFGKAYSDLRCESLAVPGGDGRSYTVEVAIPWETIGIKPQPGSELLFDLGVDDSVTGTSRRSQLMWNGTDKNSGDRTHWGRLKLLE